MDFFVKYFGHGFSTSFFLRTVFFHEKCKSHLSKNSVQLMWLQLQTLLFSFTKWICLDFEKLHYLSRFQWRWQTHILKSNKTYGSVWKFDRSLFDSFFSSCGWNIAWEHECKLTCKGNPGKMSMSKWRKAETSEYVSFCVVNVLIFGTELYCLTTWPSVDCLY